MFQEEAHCRRLGKIMSLHTCSNFPRGESKVTETLRAEFHEGKKD